jgi:hypothetical protein
MTESTEPDAALQASLDKEACREFTATHAPALDRCDLEMKWIFMSNTIFEHADHCNGPAEGFAEHVVELMASISPVRHLLARQVDGWG